MQLTQGTPDAGANDSELQMIIMTLHTRVQTIALNAELSEAYRFALAGIPCDCALCARLPARPVRLRRQPHAAHSA